MGNSDWQRVQIDEVCESIIDCVNKTAPTVTEPTIYKMIRTTNVREGWIDVENVKYVTEKTYKKWTRRSIPQKGDVILTREAPLGEVGMLRTNEPIFLGQRLVQYRADPTRLDNHFLLYSLLSHDLQGQIKAYGSGSTVEHMRVPHSKQLKLSLPPLETQRKITAVLSAYDDLIENNTRRIAILEEMAQALYREWFVHFRFPGHEAVALVEVDGGNGRNGRVPEGWKNVDLIDLYKTSSGGTPSRKKPEYFDKGTIPWVKTQELQDNFLIDTDEKITELGLNNSSAKLFPENTVIMAMYGATIGQLGILSMQATTNQACCAILTQNAPYNHIYAFCWLKANREYILSFKMGAAQQNISQKLVKKFQMLKPPAYTLEQFNSVVGPILEQIKVLQKKKINLRQTRDLLLPRLISGELDVSQLDIATPA